MSMKFDSNDRPDRGLQVKLLNENTPFSSVPFPKLVMEPCVNFQEVLASERYKEIGDNVRKYIGSNITLNDSMLMPLMMTMGSDHLNIIETEFSHRNELERLAIDLVLKEMSIPEGSFIFDVKIIGQEEFETGDFSHGSQEEIQEELDIDDEFVIPEKIDLEKTKRRLINSIIQGSSERGHYMFHLVEDRIREITGNNNIINMYGRMMSINDAMYWQLSDDTIKAMGGGEESSVAGKENVDRNTTPPTIYVRAINFPALVHEIIKGIMEVFALQGLPENYEQFKDEEDTLEKEMWDLRLGPAIWKRLRSQFPIEILTDEDKMELQNYLLVEIFKIPAKDFLYFIREILKESEDSKRMISSLMRRIEKDQTEDLEED